ncbi:MAG TPA: sigma-70 family RNA polymerase sigma factor [Candidatus Dormibacteraeota bacterium]
MSDEQPALSIVGGNPAPSPFGATVTDGWEGVYRATVILVYRYIYARVGNRADAEDLTTQVYLRALPRLRLSAAIEEIRSYLVATARTVLADHWRDRYDVRVDALEESIATPEIRRSSPHDEEAGVRRAGAILGALPDNYRRVLELRFLRGYSLRETAAELKITVSNAKVMQHRALRRAAALPEELP